jgi:hypothetical protein
MKTPRPPFRHVCAIGVSLVLPGTLSFVPIDGVSLSLLLGGAAALGVAGFACADYARKPYLGTRTSPTPTLQPSLPVQPGPSDASAAWTHQTVSA